MSKALNESYAANLDLYEKLIETNASIERKGATMPYTSLNGHMYSFLTKEGKMALRLPDGEREDFINKYDTELCVQYGAVMMVSGMIWQPGFPRRFTWEYMKSK